jgi:hypothetical protein
VTFNNRSDEEITVSNKKQKTLQQRINNVVYILYELTEPQIHVEHMDLEK